IEKLRDRFALLGSALAVACVLAAVWVRAPSLEIEIPLAEAKASLNVGYVLALGIPTITVVYAWITGTLVSMRRFQAEIVRRLSMVNEDERRLVLLRLQDSHRPEPAPKWSIERAAGIVTSMVHLFVLFVIPGLACIWIAVAYFTQLEIYPEHFLTPCGSLENSDPAASKAGQCRREVTAAEHLLGRALSKWMFHTPQARDTDRFAIANGDWESICPDIWKRADARKAKEAQTPLSEPKVEPPSGEKCVLDQFPRMMLPLNSILNLLGVALTLLLGVFGLLTHTRLPKVLSAPAPARSRE